MNEGLERSEAEDMGLLVGKRAYGRRSNTSRKRFHTSITLKSTTLVNRKNEDHVFATLESFFENFAILLLGGPNSIINAL